MNTIDFSKSFLTFQVDLQRRIPPSLTHQPLWSLNTPRIQIECRCWVKDTQTDYEEEFVLGASCKTERVGVDRDIWIQPNADFAPVVSRRHFLCIKTYDRVGRTMPSVLSSVGDQTARNCWPVDEVFDALRIDICRCPAELLDSAEGIVESTVRNQPLIARTRIQSGRYIVELDYPIKTMNASEREGTYQTDTGPVLLPDLSRDPDTMVEGLELAYCAFNNPEWIEFLVREPSEIAAGVSVYHYCQPQRFSAQNQVLRLVSQQEVVPESKIAGVCA